jgi:hypothetical protein
MTQFNLVGLEDSAHPTSELLPKYFASSFEY